jgi:hypothetical protein
MRLASVENGKVDIDVKTVAIISVLLAVVPAVLIAGVDAIIRPSADRAAVAIEWSKVDVERRKAALAAYQAALANPDAAQRKELLEFLVKARVLDDDVGTIAGTPAEQIPQWQATSTKSPSER